MERLVYAQHTLRRCLVCIYICINNDRKRLNGKVMSTCVTLACLYGTETLRNQLGTENSNSKAGCQEKPAGVK